MFRKRHLEPENMPFTETMLANMRPLKDVFPDLAEYSRQQKLGRPPKADPTVNLTVRVRKSDLAKLRALGPGYQTRISQWLHEMAESAR